MNDWKSFRTDLLLTPSAQITKEIWATHWWRIRTLLGLFSMPELIDWILKWINRIHPGREIYSEFDAG